MLLCFSLQEKYEIEMDERRVEMAKAIFNTFVISNVSDRRNV